MDAQFGKFLEVLKSPYINIPFTKALSQMHSYTKFLKEILFKRKNMKGLEQWLRLNNIVQSFNISSLPSFKILEVSLSIVTLIICILMELSVTLVLVWAWGFYPFIRSWNWMNLKLTMISFQLADRSIKYPKGVPKNISL